MINHAFLDHFAVPSIEDMAQPEIMKASHLISDAAANASIPEEARLFIENALLKHINPGTMPVKVAQILMQAIYELDMLEPQKPAD